jgi:putative transposase
MFIQPYRVEDLRFAYCYQVYLRWRTYAGRPFRILSGLDTQILQSLLHDSRIRILECASDGTDVLVQVSLHPREPISACASKLKGQVSKWLREQLQLAELLHLFSLGYFACSTGKSTRAAVERYLTTQGEHHGYEERLVPPVYLRTFASSNHLIAPKHAAVRAQFHLVLSTSFRRGVFDRRTAERVAAEWQGLQSLLRFALLKVSFVPDHVHIAVRTHPALAPADLAVALMNSAQDCLQRELIAARLDRLWQPSAYIGSYGDLTSLELREYLRNWQRSMNYTTAHVD